MSDDHSYERIRKIFSTLARSGELITHVEECGQCELARIMAKVASDLLDEHRLSLEEWSTRVHNAWSQTKYFKLMSEELAAGRDPEAAFKARGWLP